MAALTTDQLSALNLIQLYKINPTAVSSFTTTDVAVLGTSAIIGLSSNQLSALTTDVIASLSTLQVSILVPSKIVGLTSAQLGALSTAQIQHLGSYQLGAISPPSLAGFSIDQLQSLTPAQKNGLSSKQLINLSTAQIAALGSITPIVMDLTGVDALSTQNVAGLAPSAFAVLTSKNGSNGIQTEQIGKSGVTFDLANSGATNAQVGWITPGEGFLVNVPKGATSISNGSELFGSAMVLPNGQKASDGFAALSAFAQQGATVIDASNPIFNELEVWVDTGYSGEGSSGAPVGTLFTLSQLNIESLNLKPTVVNESSNGNTIGLKSSFTTTDGKTHEMADVWLASTDATSTAVNQLTQALSHYTIPQSASSLRNHCVTKCLSTSNLEFVCSESNIKPVRSERSINSGWLANSSSRK